MVILRCVPASPFTGQERAMVLGHSHCFPMPIYSYSSCFLIAIFFICSLIQFLPFYTVFLYIFAPYLCLFGGSIMGSFSFLLPTHCSAASLLFHSPRPGGGRWTPRTSALPRGSGLGTEADPSPITLSEIVFSSHSLSPKPGKLEKPDRGQTPITLRQR